MRLKSIALRSLMTGAAAFAVAIPAAAQTSEEDQAQVANPPATAERDSREPTEIIVTATKRATTWGRLLVV